MKIMFCGGGTAGHTIPNIALIELLHHRAQCYYMGTDGMEKDITQPLVDNGTIQQYCTINASKFARKFSLELLKLPWALSTSIRQARHYLLDIMPDVIFAKGGYVSLPAIIASKRLHIPSIVHESDRSLGLANKISRHYTSHMLSAFDNTEHCQKVGSILRQSIYHGSRQCGLATMGYDGTRPILLVMGGSLGAKQLNELILQCHRLHSIFDIFIITGRGKTLDTYLHQAQYIDNMADIYACTTLAITRGGANSLIELTVNHIPFVTIPLTTQSRGEQVQNSQYFADKHCGVMLDGQVSPDQLTHSILHLYNNISHYRHMASLVAIDGTHAVADKILSLAD